MTLLAILGSLLGAVIGATTALVGQQLNNRATERRERLAREVQHCEQCREAVGSFLQAAQEVDRVASHQAERPPEVLHDMWLSYHRLAVIASEQIQRPLRDFADTLNWTYWDGAPDGKSVSEHLEETRKRFGDAARAELSVIR